MGWRWEGTALIILLEKGINKEGVGAVEVMCRTGTEGKRQSMPKDYSVDSDLNYFQL